MRPLIPRSFGPPEAPNSKARPVAAHWAGLASQLESKKWQSLLKNKSENVRRRFGKKTTAQRVGMMSFGIRRKRN
jgi:hypothetical protein